MNTHEPLHKEPTHVWKRRIPASDLELWEGKLYGVSEHPAAFLHGAKKETATALIYLGDRAEAVSLIEEFGGVVEDVDPKAWQKTGAEPPAKPIRIRDQILLTMSEEEDEVDALRMRYPERSVLQIPAQMAFGTGSHATTSTCLRLLVDIAGRQKPDWSMLDMGTGSGVVALAARALGAKRVVALDNDATAVRVAEANAPRNGIEGIQFGVADVLQWSAGKPYDVVVANIFSEILLKGSAALAGAVKPGGTLILSGMLQTQMPSVLDRFVKLGIHPSQCVIRGRWATAQLESPKAPDGR